MDVNYFTCTLGQAALPGISRPFHDVNDLIDQQAVKIPHLPAVGFYTPNHQTHGYKTRVINFRGVRHNVLVVADSITQATSIPDGQPVGLLSNSSPAFLFTWLGLMRLGHPVLLIAPQCSASAIAHLCKACEVKVLFHDDAHGKLAREAVAFASQNDLPAMSNQSLPFADDEEVWESASRKLNNNLEPAVVSQTDTAYLHHTSGTSTGMPKPIPQTHKGGVAVLPSLDGSSTATFTTTPLYHGGVADLFRAWTSAALIWLFPSQHVPITATNVVKCLDASSAVAQKDQIPVVKYFSSVPYILQMMAQDKQGMKHLQMMDIVGVGGAALPPEVGNDLVSQEVNLISRFGSAECGFLMSSHRNYKEDREWQYLRKPEQVDKLRFEKQEGEQSELVILSGWPHMAKTNRDDGSFATSDLFEPHLSIPNAWKYHSRADSQLTLITGKKFDPAPLEGSLAASSSILGEVLIFGNGKPYPGALLFRSEEAKDMSDVDLIHRIAPTVEKLNVDSQGHARIPRNMLVPMAFEPTPLDKSSKGTILRGKAEGKFETQIGEAYGKTSFANSDVEDADLPDTISRIVQSVVGSSEDGSDGLTNDTDLFSYGVDSVACVQIRHALTQLLPEQTEPLPITVVEDSGSITRLTELVLQRRRGEVVQPVDDNGQLLRQLIEQYSTFDQTPSQHSNIREKRHLFNVLLTGPTGLLGAHILSQLLTDKRITKIYLLVRGASSHAAKERVRKSLSSRQLPVPESFDDKVQVMPCKLSDRHLGLSTSDYQTLTDQVDKIFHLAWAVNFLVSLRSLGSTHLAGLQNMLHLARASKRAPDFLFCSSVASVSNLLNHRKVPESIVEDLSACGSTGYAQSKLAAEIICERYANGAGINNRVTVIRVGQLSGDTRTGAWNTSEAYPLMLASSKVTGVLPDLQNEVLGWLPVDVAASGFVEASFAEDPIAALPKETDAVDSNNSKNLLRVLHLLNTNKTNTFADLVNALNTTTTSPTIIEPVPKTTWLDRLAELQSNEKTQSHPALRLLPFWKAIYGSAKPTSVSGDHDKSGARDGKVVDGVEGGDDHWDYEMQYSKTAMPSLEAAIAPLERNYLVKICVWIRDNVN